MIHYHGTPITPNAAAEAALRGGHAFISYARTDQLAIAQEVCQSYAIDNGAFSAWKSGKVVDWAEFAAWAAQEMLHPACDFVVVPDVIDGDEAANDELLAWWPLPRERSAPVWHMHETTERLLRLASGGWNRVCIGSSGEFATVGTAAWWNRMADAMNALCDENGRPSCRLHGLRMLDPEVFTKLPFASADSTNIAQNVNIDQAWRGTYQPPSKEVRATVMRSRIESHQSAHVWVKQPVQENLCFL